MEEGPVFEGVQADDEVGFESGAVEELVLEAVDLGIELVDYAHLAAAEDLLGVCDGAGDPAFEEMAGGGGELGGADDAAVEAGAGADEEDEAAAFCDAGDDFGGAAEVLSGGVEGNDVNTVADAEDVAGVCGVPKGGGVAHVGLGGHEELKGYISGAWRIGEEGVRLVAGDEVRAVGSGGLLHMLMGVVCVED